MRRASLHAITGYICLACCLWGCAPQPAGTHEHTLAISGSNTIGEYLMPQLAKAFLQAQGAELEVFSLHEVAARLGDTLLRITIRADGSMAGLADLKAGRAPIAMMSESLISSDLTGARMRLARDTILLVAHRHNPLRTLTPEQVQAIFTGQIQHWHLLVPGYEGTIQVHIRDTNSGTHYAFRQLALDGQPVSPAAKAHASHTSLLEDIRRDYYGIGYASSSELPGASQYRIVHVDSTLYCRDLWLLHPATLPPQGLAARFLAFCGGHTARDILTSMRFSAD